MKFSQEQILKLEQNVNVKAIINDKIHYTMEFKKKAIEEYLSGKSAKQIFIEAGFNLQNISTVPDYASGIISKWRNINRQNIGIHYSKKKNNSKKSAYQKLLERNQYLEAKNEFLKKLQALIEQQQ